MFFFSILDLDKKKWPLEYHNLLSNVILNLLWLHCGGVKVNALLNFIDNKFIQKTLITKQYVNLKINLLDQKEFY